jgi:hypothetical protein
MLGAALSTVGVLGGVVVVATAGPEPPVAVMPALCTEYAAAPPRAITQLPPRIAAHNRSLEPNVRLMIVYSIVSFTIDTRFPRGGFTPHLALSAASNLKKRYESAARTPPMLKLGVRVNICQVDHAERVRWLKPIDSADRDGTTSTAPTAHTPHHR